MASATPEQSRWVPDPAVLEQLANRLFSAIDQAAVSIDESPVEPISAGGGTVPGGVAPAGGGAVPGGVAPAGGAPGSSGFPSGAFGTAPGADGSIQQPARGAELGASTPPAPIPGVPNAVPVAALGGLPATPPISIPSGLPTLPSGSPPAVPPAASGGLAAVPLQSVPAGSSTMSSVPPLVDPSASGAGGPASSGLYPNAVPDVPWLAAAVPDVPWLEPSAPAASGLYPNAEADLPWLATSAADLPWLATSAADVPWLEPSVADVPWLAAAVPDVSWLDPSMPGGTGLSLATPPSAGQMAPPLPAASLPGTGQLGAVPPPFESPDRHPLATGPYYFLTPSSPPVGAVPPAALDDAPTVGASQPRGAASLLDVNLVRKDFPILEERVNGRPLVWLDNAATTQKPRAVIERLTYFYEHENSNIHRAAHELAARATDAYEAARQKVARFLGARSPDEIVFVRGGTEAINLVAQSWGRRHVTEGDEILISHLEHHANIVPWRQLADEVGARLKVIPVDDSGQLLLDEFHRLLSDRTRIVSVTQVSNALGTVVPVPAIVAGAREAGACVLIDGAQAVSHMRVDMQALDADFYVFSGHKVFGPTGIGVLYGKAAVLESMPPWQGGGNMIKDVTFESVTYQPPPLRFEAGTGNIADAVGLGAALDYLDGVGLELVTAHEHQLLHYATGLMESVPGLRMIGTAPVKAGVLSFVLDGYSTEEVGKALDREGIAVRAGHHCAQPILRRMGVESTVRPSLALYNTFDDIDQMLTVLHKLASRRRR